MASCRQEGVWSLIQANAKMLALVYLYNERLQHCHMDAGLGLTVSFQLVLDAPLRGKLQHQCQGLKHHSKQCYDVRVFQGRENRQFSLKVVESLDNGVACWGTCLHLPVL